MDLSYFWFEEEDIFDLLNSTVGIEKESLRIDQDGSLSQHSHKHGGFGNRSFHPYIQTDFADVQLELVTPPSASADELSAWLQTLHQISATAFEDDFIWPCSMPGQIPDDRDQIKIAQLEDPIEYNYRAHLVDTYGKDVQLISGIHFNLELNPKLVKSRCASWGQSGNDSTPAAHYKGNTESTHLKNELYMQLGRQYFRYRWLLTYLLGAAPFAPDNYRSKLYGQPQPQPMRSIRQSHFGYQNAADLSIDYSSIESMVESLEAAVKSGQLSMEKELYRDVRFRGSKHVRDLISKGISYIEFRNIDLNPLASNGIDRDTIEFIRLFLVTLLFLPNQAQMEEVQLGNQMNQSIALSHPLDPCPYLEEGQDIFQAMRYIANRYLDQGGQDLTPLLDRFETGLKQVNQTLAGQLITQAPTKHAFFNLAMDLADQHRDSYLTTPYLLHGFEDFELSSQDLMKEAIKAGLRLDIIDAQDNLIKLSYDGHEEYIRNGNMTSHDSLISYYLMENKVATKYILAQEGIRVPKGNHFDNYDRACRYYDTLPFSAFVVKPKNTNYGLGISIFKHKPHRKAFEEALSIAFEEDTTILIEEFIPGSELRFYVQANRVLAVCERQPAQVVGDGIHTVSQLIDQANQHPLRGKKHFAPMTLLDKGKNERLQLAEQDLTFDSIPDEDQVVFLRENTNVSTGGLSIDRTNQVDSFYKDLAIQSAQALGATFCGVDIILSNYRKPPISDHDFAVLEANFNPSMSIHRFVGRGPARYLGRAVIDELFPELK